MLKSSLFENSTKKVIGFFRLYSSIAVLVLSITSLYLFISIEFYSVIGPILGVSIGASSAVILLLVSKHKCKSTSTFARSTSIDSRFYFVLPSIYIITVTWLLRNHTYSRPALLYLLFGCYAGAIGYQVAVGESKYKIIPQILILSFFTYWSSQFLFPAGMYAPDSKYRYIPVIKEISSTYHIPASEIIYAGHLAYVTEFLLISGTTAQIAYFLLSTVVLCGTVLLLGNIDAFLPSISTQVGLYAALVFSIMSWMIGRGMHPNKLNFFYPLILLLGIASFVLCQRGIKWVDNSRAWLSIGLVVSPALIFGHQYSAGAGLVFISCFGIFIIINRIVLKERMKLSLTPFILVYALGLIGNPIHQGSLLSRFSDIALSIVAGSGNTVANTGTSLGGPGRYSQLPFDVLLVSTAAQAILFGMATVGATWMLRRSDWEYDFVIFWIGTIAILLFISLTQNSVDTAPQRFYSLLGVFGINICAAVFLWNLGNNSILSQSKIPVRIGPLMVATVLILLAITSLASPVADKATSPVDDDLPHFRQYDTTQLSDAIDWGNQYTTDYYSIVPPSTNLTVQRTGERTGKVILPNVKDPRAYLYSTLADRTGIISDSGLNLGGREYVFVESPTTSSDGKIYDNGKEFMYIR